MNMTRLFHSIALASGLAMAAAGAMAQDKITLKLADQFPLTHVASKIGPQAFKTLLEERSEGRITVEHYPAQQIAKAAGLLDAVKNRVTDIALVGVVYNTDRLPLTSVAELPGMTADSVKASDAFDAYIKTDILEQEYLRNKVRPLWGTVTPPYQIMLGKGDGITDISQIEGLKLRVAGATGELIAKSLDAVPVKVPASDLYLALQRGTVDGAIYNPPSVFGYKIEEVLSAVSSNASLGAVAFAALVNEDVWQGLSEEDRALIQEVANEVQTSFVSSFAASSAEAYEKLRAADVTVFDLNEATLTEINTRLQSVVDDWVDQVGARGLPAADMLEAYRAQLAAQD